MEKLTAALLCAAILYGGAAAVIATVIVVSSLRVHCGTDGPADKERLIYLREMRSLATSGSVQDAVFVALALPLIAWFAVFP